MACHKLRQAASQRISSRFLNAVCYAVGIFLIPDVLSYHGFVYPDRADIISACPECLVSSSPSPPLRMSVVKHHRTLSFQHTDTAYFGGIRMLTCMWSIQTAPSTSSSLYISSNRFMVSLISARHSPYRTFFRYFGINTMWYVQSHFVCAELSSCIFLSPVFLSEMRCYRFSTLSRETFSCSITVRVKRTVAPQAEPVDFFWY